MLLGLGLSSPLPLVCLQFGFTAVPIWVYKQNLYLLFLSVKP